MDFQAAVLPPCRLIAQFISSSLQRCDRRDGLRPERYGATVGVAQGEKYRLNVGKNGGE
jgi:hypothetical protein